MTDAEKLDRILAELQALRTEIASLRNTPEPAPEWLTATHAMKRLGFKEPRQLKAFCRINGIRSKRITGTVPKYPLSQLLKALKNPL